MKRTHVIVKLIYNHPSGEEVKKYLHVNRKTRQWVSNCSLATQYDNPHDAMTVLDSLTPSTDHHRIDEHYVKE